MTPFSTKRWLLTGLIAVAAALAGAGGVYMLMSGRQSAAPATQSATAVPPAPGATGPAAITLSPEAIKRAGIVVETVTVGPVEGQLKLPGRIAADAYKETVVTSVTEGRAAAVDAELGAKVTRGHVLAHIDSPSAADLQREYLSMLAEREAAHAKLMRTEQLVALGSVSQQELEATRAEHLRHSTDVESARARLKFLGVSADRLDRLTSPEQISGLVDIVAPLTGTVTRRQLNAGQNVAAGTELFAIADLSTVWVVVDVYEQDLAAVHVGNALTITTPAFAGVTWKGRVSYVDPQVGAATRTVHVRAEVTNADGRLQPGMYVDVAAEGAAGRSAVQVPRAAVQTLGSQQVVYVADAAQNGRFIERPIQTRTTTGESLEVVSGLSAGERIVTAGAFFLRAERDRLGLPLPTATPERAAATLYSFSVIDNSDRHSSSASQDRC